MVSTSASNSVSPFVNISDENATQRVFVQDTPNNDTTQNVFVIINDFTVINTAQSAFVVINDFTVINGVADIKKNSKKKSGISTQITTWSSESQS